MPSNKLQHEETVFINRLNKLISANEKLTGNTSDKEATNRYIIPDNIDEKHLEEQAEQLLNQLILDNNLNDDMDDIYSLIDDTTASPTMASDPTTSIDSFEKANKKLQQLEDVFLTTVPNSSDIHLDVDETTDELIQKMKDMAHLDSKYEQFIESTDQELKERYLKLKKDAPKLPDSYGLAAASDKNKPRGTVPSSMSKDELLHNEMEDWCCICNEDATIVCEDCDDEDNKYCKDCFYHLHQSEEADYEATKHKSKIYRRLL
ncbi:hypothetical protein BDF20DRAFT_833427 [Mycotypha africana]|uniref:uncharacterized protein n=1 Tax=Mycotypha africana TaxID=64632 RepID=UPI0022FFE2A3|nr:uncharacterized protein BDF20DRAFT_833427 [Mycotypha africana]KAI8988593.1 hypothetical protein BDF20DRAFT_833427 [Mycotypha africana]